METTETIIVNESLTGTALGVPTGTFAISLTSRQRQALALRAESAGQSVEELLKTTIAGLISNERAGQIDAMAGHLLGPCSHCAEPMGELALTASTYCSACSATHQVGCDLTRHELASILASLPEDRHIETLDAYGRHADEHHSEG